MMVPASLLWNRRQMPLSFVAFSIFVFLVEAPHSHSRRSSSSLTRSRTRGSVQYDRSISIFSDDGRLLQVEYSAESSNKGGSVACLKATRKLSSSFVCFAIGTSNGQDDDEEASLSLPVSDKVHRVDDHCVLITTGLAGDGRFLALTTRLACQKHRLKNGEPPSILEIANMVAQTQHQLTRTSGSRPLGVTATIVGVDPINTGVMAASSGAVSSIRLFQCDAGGIVNEYDFCASGRGKKRSIVALSKLQQKFLFSQRRLEDRGVGNDDFDEVFSNEALVEGVARAILDGDDGSACRVDVWLIITDSSCRGKARFRFAKAVSSKELDTVKRLLSRRN